MKLSILNHLDNNSLTDVSKQLNMKMPILEYHIAPLKKEGIIRKVGYGVWHVDWEKWNAKQLQLELRMSPSSQECRGHYWQIRVQIPQIANWHNREQYLKDHNIAYKPIHGQMLSIDVDGTKVWLGNKVVILHLSKQLYGVNAVESEVLALDLFEKIIKKVESILNISLRQNKGYKFTIPHSHYGLIKNSMAHIYNKRKEKLYVYDQTGCWGWIDFSDNIDEFETGGKYAKPRNMIMQQHLNEIIETELHPKQILNMFKMTHTNIQDLTKQVSAINASQAYFAENNQSHVDSIKQNRETTKLLADEVKKLSSAIKSLSKSKAIKTIGSIKSAYEKEFGHAYW